MHVVDKPVSLRLASEEMFSGLLKHTPPSTLAASSASSSPSSSSDQNNHDARPTPTPQTPTIPRGHLVVGPKDQLRLLAPVGSSATSNHCTATIRASNPLTREDDDGGGGRVKKKRKKKDKRDKSGDLEEEQSRGSSKPKKRKEEKERGPTLVVLSPRKSKEPKEKKEKKSKNKDVRKDNGTGVRHLNVVGPGVTVAPIKIPGKRGRKPKIKILPPIPPGQGLCGQGQRSGPRPRSPSGPKQRGRKPNVCSLPVEKKKKGKRRKEELLLESVESDDTTSTSGLTVGGEDSQDPLDSSEPPEDEANIIEKILAVRPVKKETLPSMDQSEEAEEFFVKYRNFSYLHCKWATLEELEKDPRIHQKIKRFRTKQAQTKHLFTEPDEDLFNPDYVEVDRVLEVAVTTDTETGEEVTHYLVKWCSLSYEEATWELQEDLDPEKVKEFQEIQKPPADLRHVERPSPEKWQKLESSRDYRNGNQLREYQLEGMNWLLFNWYNRKNCILADEMGLGKTIQSITFLYEMFSLGIRGPFLIIAPLSTITNWEREFRTWTHMNVIVYHGSQISRQMILQYEMFYRDTQGNTIPGGLKFHGLITTFEMIMADCPELKKLNWRCVVIDEVKKLQAILKPMMLRRLKDDVEKNLAPKEETIIEVELTNIQKKYYRAILEKNFSFLSKGANQHNMPNLINTMMELRKCCNHPYLITGAEEKILESFRKSHSPDAPDFQLQAMIQAAGKLVLIDKLLPKLLSGGHKVLVFSQMVRCLDILEDYLIQRRYTYERIDGRVRGNLRQAAIDRFCKPDSDRFVFLLCTRAGGLGINLTAADTCIIFDSDWNPQNDLQAQARCHRIGQSKAVKVYRLITRNSYEREMFDKASLKLGLDKAVLQDINRKGSLNGVQQLSKLEVEDLLKKGAYGALMDEEDEGSKFCEEDIDQILQRRTQTITIQSEGKGSTLLSFVSSGNRTDISLDDPNFWQKWAKIAEVEIDSRSEKESLVIDTPRVRKQTRHYNSFEDDELMEFSELDSDSEDRPCRTRRLGDRGRRYLRAECFRVEKNLLIFGWGRWKDILNHGRFKWHLAERDMEVICRALLVYCLKHYKGDDKIKSFIWDLIAPTKDGQEDQILLNHSRISCGCLCHSLSAPVPRGRKGKKLKIQEEWRCRVQTGWYTVTLRWCCRTRATRSTSNNTATISWRYTPDIDYIEIPASWWDADADKSLLIGVHKHGYERYNAMRADPELCFLERVGMPDVTALSAEQGGVEASADTTDSGKSAEETKEEAENKAEGGEEREENGKGGEETCSSTDTSDKPDSTAPEPPPAPDSQTQLSLDLTAQDATLVTTTTTGSGMGVAALQLVQTRPLWPTGPALTARLRRLITSYQRFTLRREPMLRHDFLLHDGLVAMGIGGGAGHHGPLAWQLGEELRRCTVVPTESDPLFLEWQRRWTRREQADFYRTVSSFGVVYDPERKVYDWSQFRALARLERKTDESLERYFNSFVNMCRTACKLPPRKEEGLIDPALVVEPLTEERAARTLYRIELLRKIREQVLRHPLLTARLQLCRPSLYLPVWWESGKHDRDLLLGAARHGLSRTDFYILNDPQLSFLEAHRNYVRGHPGAPHHPGLTSHPGIPQTSVQLPHCCMYESGMQPPDYHQQTQHHPVPSPAPQLDPHDPGVGMGAGTRAADFMDCPPLDESLELSSLQHDTDSLHGGKGSKDALNGFPFNSAAGGQSMLNSYGVGGADLDSKLRSDVLVGEQGSSEESGLMAPSVELNQIQDIGVTEEPSADQTDLSASPPPPYVPPPPLSLSDITDHEPQDRLEQSDVTESLTNPVEEEEEEEEEGQDGTGFQFDKKEDEEMQTDAEAKDLDTDPVTEPDVMMDVSNSLSEDLQGAYSDTVDPFLGKLDQDSSLACSESLGEPGEDVDQIMLYQPMEPGNPLNTDVLMDNATDDFLQPPTLKDDCTMQNTELANDVGALSEEQADPVSLMEVPMLQPDEEIGEKVVQVEVTDLEENPCKVKSEEPSDEDDKSNFETDIKPDPTLFENSTDFSNLLANEEVEEKLPIKMEEAKQEEDMLESYDEAMETKPLAVKSETSTKVEQLDFPIKDEDAKPQNLRLKQENVDSKANVFQLAYSDEVKSEIKPLELQSSFADLKTEAKPEDLSTFADHVKSEMKTEGLELTACPDSTGVKAETGEADELEAVKEEAKQELLEADSTVMTPKMEQAAGGGNDGPENLCKSQVKEEPAHTPAPVLEAYSGSPRFATPMSMCDIPDSLHDSREREPTIAQLLQEKALYSFSEWPKDRVIINRLDSVCHAILKGKWPSSNEQYDSPGVLAANSCLANSLAQQQQQRAGFLSTSSVSVPGQAGLQEVTRKRPKSCPAAISAPLPSLDMAGILQAGLIHPVTGQIVNGSLRSDDALRRRRGRRRNVEASTLSSRGAISHSTVSSSTSSPSPSPSDRPCWPPYALLHPDPARSDTAPAEIVAIDREAASKGLMEWLRQNPGYSMDLPAFAHTPGASVLHGFIERPKQRRHRCKDPTKLDVNSLTGEERVPVVHRGTGRRLGGAMAPAIKELSRWLDANSEYFVAPDWADVVKHSGYLPEGKFTRILTEPVNRDAARRRGRRPRSEMPKPLLSVSDASPTTLGPPIFMNGGLIGSVDTMVAMQNLRGAAISGLPISGIMAAGFPHGFPGASSSADDAKNGLSMLPMMLHGIPHGAAIPQHAMLSVGMMAHAPPPAKANQAETASPTSSTTEKESSEKDKSKEESGEGSKKAVTTTAPAIVEQAAIITSTSRGHIGAAHIGTSASSHLTFNPFLIPACHTVCCTRTCSCRTGASWRCPLCPRSGGRRPGKSQKEAQERGGERRRRKGPQSRRQLTAGLSDASSAKDEKSENVEVAPESQDGAEEAASEEEKKEEVVEEQRQAKERKAENIQSTFL
ncbi:hypothetical protein WMY93_011731 [Mugilogobius chulae]|uniref:DNA helicase n=1 Tax=Mugilogobius chulae TaxID=88201 RepID=A0AAW0P3P1_9GOBI